MKAIYPNDAVDKADYKVAYPNTWIRLKRTGDVFDSYFSNDNKTWHHYSTFNIQLPTELYLGMAVTAHHPTSTATAVFSNAQLSF
jgi:regulation of enolase protein 1 (concanavalin A-like superfamily)